VTFGCSEPTPAATAEVKTTTAEGAALRPEGLGARSHALGPDVAARPRKLLPLRHRTICHWTICDRTIRAPVDVTIMSILQSRRDSPGSIIALAHHPMDCIRMLGIGTVPEDVAMLGGGTIPECVARRCVVGASEPRRQAGVVIRYAMTMLWIMVPGIVGDVGMV
jgi:hypothetical protein